MPPDTEVISCPACRHVVRVPADWLGTAVQCPECQAKFTAPVRDGDRLTEPMLISAPVKAAPGRAVGDSLLWLPAWGLMLLGVVAVVLDAVELAAIVADPAGYEEAKRAAAEAGAEQFGQDRQLVRVLPIPLDRAGWQAALHGWGVLCGLGSFAGGLAVAVRRGRRVAQLGCVLAAVNLPNLCCVPGALFGLWGLLMLMGEEGRAHFLGMTDDPPMTHH